MSSERVLPDHRVKVQPSDKHGKFPALAVPQLPGQECSLEVLLLQTHLGKFPSPGLGGGGGELEISFNSLPEKKVPGSFREQWQVGWQRR